MRWSHGTNPGPGLGPAGWELDVGCCCGCCAGGRVGEDGEVRDGSVFALSLCKRMNR